MASTDGNDIPPFEVLDGLNSHAFTIPSKQIHEGSDVSLFQVSHAYRDILAFLMRLNRSMFPAMEGNATKQGATPLKSFSLDNLPATTISAVSSLQKLLQELDGLIEQAPPDPGPRRFGNVSFRTWSNLVDEQCSELLRTHLPSSVLDFKHDGPTTPLEEIRPYLLGAFGSPQRLDYGTGHELSFLAFVGCVWKLGGFGCQPAEDELRQIVMGVIQPFVTVPPYRTSLTFLGSHGVWGLDDHSFVPYIFGSAQLGPAVPPQAATPTEGSIRGAPDPGKVTSMSTVEQYRRKNMYFGAIGFINDVKKGPFWEHSPTLYDISGVRAGWGKINKVITSYWEEAIAYYGFQGMLKMYDAEVLGKFPVIQHFPFGSLFSFGKDASARQPMATAHTQSLPQTGKGPVVAHMGPGTDSARMHTNSPTASSLSRMPPQTRAPWAK